MTTDKRLKLTHLIKQLTDESVEQLLESSYWMSLLRSNWHFH